MDRASIRRSAPHPTVKKFASLMYVMSKSFPRQPRGCHRNPWVPEITHPWETLGPQDLDSNGGLGTQGLRKGTQRSKERPLDTLGIPVGLSSFWEQLRTTEVGFGGNWGQPRLFLCNCKDHFGGNSGSSDCQRLFSIVVFSFSRGCCRCLTVSY